MFACYAGSCRPVRRQEYPPDSAPAVGVTWQWAGDTAGQFHSYNTEVSSLLEKAHRCSASAIDLNRHPFYLPYIVRLSDMLQIRNETNYKRRIQRVLLPQPYMPTSSNFSHVAVSPLPATVLQFGNATVLGLPGTSSVDPGSLVFPSLFPSSRLSFGFPPHSASSSALAVGPSWGSTGLHGGSTGSISTVASPFVSSGNPVGQMPLFTIGRSVPSNGTTRRKRVRDLTLGGR